MTTVAEAYFLVRTGMWGEDDLETYICDQISDAEDEAYDNGYKEGMATGYKDGQEDGQEDMYKQAMEAVKCLR